MRLLAALLALLVLVAPAAHAQAPDLSQIPPLRTEPATARTRELAQQLVQLDPGVQNIRPGLERGAQFMQPFIKEKVDPGLLAAMEQAFTEKPEVLAELQARAVDVYARSYTDEELEAMVRYRRSPLAASIINKRLAAPPLTQAVLTSEEKAYEDAFTASPMGAQLKKKQLEVRMLNLVASFDLVQQVVERAKVIYCKDRPDCPPAAVRSAPSASAPSTARP
ncbi:DUF2059 domain-containing protein [Phenylobacterium deserti]|uniref:DUF2059 domain-containing protein n=1 Tax=Phenylobacterium deserti TaxID=1914756 RepID=A0A328AWY2_9CAUL|nr:DUF2059 domain-containing protein [Phenylobacterium deserti]RAK58094.1 hypothetical protein DJ018_09355 [Phenylobacterium deserti]